HLQIQYLSVCLSKCPEHQNNDDRCRIHRKNHVPCRHHIAFLSRVPYKYNSARRYSLQNLAVPSKTEHLSCSTFESSYLKSTRNSTSQYDPVLYRKDTSLLSVELLSCKSIIK